MSTNYCTNHRRWLSVNRFWKRAASWNGMNQRCSYCVKLSRRASR